VVDQRRRNLFWPLLFIFVGLVMLLQVTGGMPAYLWDLLVRLWPLLLIIFGLAAIVGKRTPTTNALILIGLFALVIVVFAAGYTRQALELRNDNQQTVDLDLEGASDVTIQIDLNLTELVVDAQDEATGRLLGEFVGSTENELTVNPPRGRGTQREVLLTETNVHPIPMLDEFGGNRLTLHLPPDLPLKLIIDGRVGNIDADLSGLSVRHMEAGTSLGDVTVVLDEDSLIAGDLSTAQGDVTLRFPESLPVKLQISRGTLGSNLARPQELLPLEGGGLMTPGYRDDEIRADMSLTTRFGDIFVEYSE
jgi:hypothetical protein